MAAARIEYKGAVHEFQKLRHLSEHQFLDRCWFIVKNKDVQNVEAYADLWVAMRHYDVTYTTTVMAALAEMEKRVWS